MKRVRSNGAFAWSAQRVFMFWERGKIGTHGISAASTQWHTVSLWIRNYTKVKLGSISGDNIEPISLLNLLDSRSEQEHFSYVT